MGSGEPEPEHGRVRFIRDRRHLHQRPITIWSWRDGEAELH